MANPVCFDINLINSKEKRNLHIKQMATIFKRRTLQEIFKLTRSQIYNILYDVKHIHTRKYIMTKCERCGKVVKKRSDYKSEYCVSCGRAKPWDGRRLSDKIKVKCIDCGKEITRLRKSWLNGKKKCNSCVSKVRKLPKGEASFNAIYNQYKNGAKKKAIIFNLTKNEFRNIINKECYYCGIDPSNEKKTTSGDTYIYNGVDRIDSNNGYILNNVVSCCKDCNYAKNILSKEDFYSLIKRIYTNLKKRREI